MDEDIADEEPKWLASEVSQPSESEKVAKRKTVDDEDIQVKKVKVSCAVTESSKLNDTTSTCLIKSDTETCLIKSDTETAAVTNVDNCKDEKMEVTNPVGGNDDDKVVVAKEYSHDKNIHHGSSGSRSGKLDVVDLVSKKLNLTSDPVALQDLQPKITKHLLESFEQEEPEIDAVIQSLNKIHDLEENHSKQDYDGTQKQSGIANRTAPNLSVQTTGTTVAFESGNPLQNVSTLRNGSTLTVLEDQSQFNSGCSYLATTSELEAASSLPCSGLHSTQETILHQPDNFADGTVMSQEGSECGIKIYNVFTADEKEFESDVCTPESEVGINSSGITIRSASDIYIGKGYPYSEFQYKCHICRVSFNSQRDITVHNRSPIHYKTMMSQKNKYEHTENDAICADELLGGNEVRGTSAAAAASKSTGQQHSSKKNYSSKRLRSKSCLKIGNKIAGSGVLSNLMPIPYIPLNMIKRRIIIIGDLEKSHKKNSKNIKTSKGHVSKDTTKLPIMFIPYQVRVKAAATGEFKLVTMYLPHFDIDTSSSILKDCWNIPGDCWIGEVDEPIKSEWKFHFNNRRSHVHDEASINKVLAPVPSNAATHTIPISAQKESVSFHKDRKFVSWKDQESKNLSESEFVVNREELFMRKLGLTSVRPQSQEQKKDFDSNGSELLSLSSDQLTSYIDSLISKNVTVTGISTQLVEKANAQSDSFMTQIPKDSYEISQKYLDFDINKKLLPIPGSIGPKSTQIHKNSERISQKYLTDFKKHLIPTSRPNSISPKLKPSSDQLSHRAKSSAVDQISKLITNPSPGVPNSVKIKPSEFRQLKIAVLKLQRIDDTYAGSTENEASMKSEKANILHPKNHNIVSESGNILSDAESLKYSEKSEDKDYKLYRSLEENAKIISELLCDVDNPNDELKIHDNSIANSPFMVIQHSDRSPPKQTLNLVHSSTGVKIFSGKGQTTGKTDSCDESSLKTKTGLDSKFQDIVVNGNDSWGDNNDVSDDERISPNDEENSDICDQYEYSDEKTLSADEGDLDDKIVDDEDEEMGESEYEEDGKMSESEYEEDEASSETYINLLNDLDSSTSPDKCVTEQTCETPSGTLIDSKERLNQASKVQNNTFAMEKLRIGRLLRVLKGEKTRRRDAYGKYQRENQTWNDKRNKRDSFQSPNRRKVMQMPKKVRLRDGTKARGLKRSLSSERANAIQLRIDVPSFIKKDKTLTTRTEVLETVTDKKQLDIKTDSKLASVRDKANISVADREKSKNNEKKLETKDVIVSKPVSIEKFSGGAILRVKGSNPSVIRTTNVINNSVFNVVKGLRKESHLAKGAGSVIGESTFCKDTNKGNEGKHELSGCGESEINTIVKGSDISASAISEGSVIDSERDTEFSKDEYEHNKSNTRVNKRVDNNSGKMSLESGEQSTTQDQEQNIIRIKSAMKYPLVGRNAHQEAEAPAHHVIIGYSRKCVKPTTDAEDLKSANTAAELSKAIVSGRGESVTEVTTPSVIEIKSITGQKPLKSQSVDDYIYVEAKLSKRTGSLVASESVECSTTCNASTDPRSSSNSPSQESSLEDKVISQTVSSSRNDSDSHSSNTGVNLKAPSSHNNEKSSKTRSKERSSELTPKVVVLSNPRVYDTFHDKSLNRVNFGDNVQYSADDGDDYMTDLMEQSTSNNKSVEADVNRWKENFSDSGTNDDDDEYNKLLPDDFSN